MTVDQSESSAAEPLAGAKLWWLMGGLMLGLFLSSVEQSVVATALPTIAGELGSANQIAWVVSAYLLTSTIVTPVYGKMSDLIGRRPVYLTSVSIFLVGSALSGLAPTMPLLIAARAVQGLGGGGLMSLAFVIIGDVISPRERGRWMGLFTGIFTFSAVSGPLIGGLLVDGPGWRWVFWAVVPIAALTLVITSRGLDLPFATRQARVDWLGIGLLVIGSTALILIPVWGGSTFAWASREIAIIATIAIVATIAFIVHESRTEEAVMPMRLFADRTGSAIYAMGFLLMASLAAVTTFLPFFLQVATGASATRSGLMLTPQTIGITLVATLSGWLVTKTGRYRWGLILGPAVATLALWWLTTIGPDTGAVALSPILFLFGTGLGLVFPNLTLTVQNNAPAADLGIATSTSNFFRSMGGAFGAAAGGAILAGQLDDNLLDRLGPTRLDEVGGADGLIRSPERVRSLTADLREPVIEAVSDSVVAIIWRSLPIMAVMVLIALLVRERPLRLTATIGSETTDDSNRADNRDGEVAAETPD